MTDVVRRGTLGLLVVFAFTVAWENLVGLGSIGRVSKGVGLLLGALWLYSLVLHMRVRRPAAAHVLAGIFALWSATSVLWSVAVQETTPRVVTVVQLFAVLLIVWDVVEDLRQMRLVMSAYVLGAWVPAALMLHGFATGQAEVLHGRVTVGGFHPNDVGVVLALALPLAWYLASTSERQGTTTAKVLYYAYMPVAVFAVLLTGSRTSLALLLVFGAWCLGDLARRRPAVALLLLGGVVLAAVRVVVLIPDRSLGRLASTEEELQGGLTGRVSVWDEAFGLIRARPLHGSGAGSFRDAAVESSKVGHNFVLGLLVEVGLVGLLLFLGLLLATLVAGRSAPGRLKGMWTTILVMWLVAAAFHNWEYRKQSWLLFGLALVCGRLAARPEAASPSETSASRVAARDPDPVEHTSAGHRR